MEVVKKEPTRITFSWPKTKEDVKFYSARGTFITRMIDLRVHPIVVAEQRGNSPETIYKHYYKHTKHDEVKQIVLAGL